MARRTRPWTVIWCIMFALLATATADTTVAHGEDGDDHGTGQGDTDGGNGTADPPVDPHRPTVASDDQGVPANMRTDLLANLTLDWLVTQQGHPSIADFVVDLEGAGPANGPGVAYRVHGDIAAIEGTLTMPRPLTGVRDPVYNTGLRTHALLFDPPLTLADGTNLSTIFPGPLEWAKLLAGGRIADPGGASHTFDTWAHVSLPRNGTSPPASGTTGDWTPSGLTLHWGVQVQDEPVADALTGYRAATNARFHLHLVINASALAEGVDPTQHDVALVMHFDFGAQANGWTTGPTDDVDAVGMYLNRSYEYAHLRLVGGQAAPRIPWPNAPGSETPWNVTYQAPYGYPITTPEARIVFTPLSLNATGRLVPISETGWQIAGSPVVPDGAFGLRWFGELGYMMVAEPEPPAADPEPESPSVPGPGVGLLVLVCTLAAWRGRARTR